MVALSDVAARVVDRRSARRPRDRVRFLQDHRRQQGRAESRDAEAAGGKGRGSPTGRRPDREGGGKEGSQGRARAAADALAKDKSKKSEPKKADVKPPTPPKKPAPPTPKFDPKQVAALLDKRDSTRLAAAGETLNSAPSLGLSNGAAAQLALSELEALRARLAQLWTVPAGAKDPQE